MTCRVGGLPARIYTNGSQAWHIGGKRHRGGGLPAVMWVNNIQEWWIDNIFIACCAQL
jgi:hypothetical protein